MATQLTQDQLQALVDKAGQGLYRTWQVMAAKLGAAMSPATQQVGNSLAQFLQGPAQDAGSWLAKASEFPEQLAACAKSELARGVQDDGTLAAVVQKAPMAAQQIRQWAQQAGAGPSKLFMVLGAAAILGVSWWTYKSMTKGKKQLGSGRQVEELDEDAGEDEPEESLSDWDDPDDGNFGGGDDVMQDTDDEAQEFGDLDEDEPEEQLSGHTPRRRRKTKVKKHIVTWG